MKFYLKLDKKDLKIQQLREVEIDNEYDIKVFNSLTAAEKYLAKYKKTLDSLEKLPRQRPNFAPPMLLKRRYLVQTKLGEKLSTWRDYDRKWPKGTIFYFHDQTYFLDVKLKSITKEDPETFRYDFELL